MAQQPQVLRSCPVGVVRGSRPMQMTTAQKVAADAPYPQRLIDAILRNGGGVPANQPGAVRVTDTDLWHVQLLTSAVTRELTYFGVAQARDVTNWPMPGQMSNNTAFIIRSIMIDLKPVGAEADAAALAPITLLEQISNALETGTLFLSSNQQEFLNVRDLRRFPSGRGLWTAPAATANAAASAVAIQSNGWPAWGNTYTFKNPITLYPNQQITAQLTWATAPTITGNANLEWRFHGTLVKL